MKPEYIKHLIINDQRQRNVSLDEAADALVMGLGLSDRSPVDLAVAQMREEARRLESLKVPGGVEAAAYREAKTSDARELHWYTGPRDSDRYWGHLRRGLEASSLAPVLPEIDAASSKVVAHFADPGVRRLKKKGLVLGYVQSGKTANYAAVAAKAADAGYRLCIVMSGLHNNLRRQTQVRLNRDLGVSNWAALTTDDRDFGEVLHGQALLQNPQMRTLAVVKKNPVRLQRLRDWLKNIDPTVRAQAPILLLDDEADQATPNSLAARQELSRINALIREIWSEIPTGSYVGYTATPFANIFMDPNDELELYPSDFILDLPRSPEYFGAERIFGRQTVADAADPEPGLDMIRSIPLDEAETLRPPHSAEKRQSYDPPLTDSLVDAVVWFLIATSIRRLRGDNGHSSMLVHTTSYVAPHFALASKIEGYLFQLRRAFNEGDLSEFEASFLREVHRVTGVNEHPAPAWDEVAAVLVDVLEEVRVVVDNGRSTDRLDYGRRTESGQAIHETVIAVGGGTLSRGLTLEGLCVSYFTRTTNTYDTLLQMGRWFGYRPGYEDLPRIWMTDELNADFAFLATVEEELRVEIRRLATLGVTPREMGIRVRAHAGRLSITSPDKMHHAKVVQLSFAGQRHQTFILHERETEVLEENIAAARRLANRCQDAAEVGIQTPSRRQFLNVDVTDVCDFLRGFRFHPTQGLRSGHVVDWIERHARQLPWNVVFIGTETKHVVEGRGQVDLGKVDLGFDAPMPMVNRAPLRDGGTNRANIKALLSAQDWVADLDPDVVAHHRSNGISFPDIRATTAPDTGTLIVYAVSNRSVPLRAAQAKSRREMQAEVPVIGLGIIFPELAEEGRAADGEFIAVTPTWTPRVDEEIEEIPEDDEKSNTVDAEELMRTES
ncbi:Z1 domain-containing protein [Terrabacter lapilli]|uniref:Z1 domain-containing protein n=1 Tax=Terrabacter lapilli TaxID=436231 RepID=A0ABN2S414_9MICO